MKRILPLVRARAGRLVLVGCAMAGAALANVVSLYTMKPAIDWILAPAAGVAPPESGLPPFLLSFFARNDRGTLLVAVAAFFAAVRLLYAILFYIQKYGLHAVGEEIVNEIRVALADRLVAFPPAALEGKRAGDLTARLAADLTVVSQLFATTLGDLLRRPIEVVLLVAVLFAFDPYLAALSLGIAPFVAAAIHLLTTTLRRRARRMQEKMGDLAARLQEIASGIRTIQAFRGEAREAARFRREAAEYLRRAKRTFLVQVAPPPVTEAIAAVAVAVLLVVGGRRVLSGGMTLGSYFTFLAMLLAAYQPVRALVHAAADLGRARAALDRVFAVLDAPDAVRDGTEVVTEFRDAIRFEGVRVVFPDGTAALDGVDLSIRKGETVALVGRSGAGKTTVANLLVRFLDPTEGRVTLDGRDLRTIRLASLRRLVGLVGQDPFLFHDTVRANVAYGRPGASDEEVRAALAAANFPDAPLDAVVGERGSRFSGGERQRIAIARVLLLDPAILVLDEATSALDAESERAVAAALDRAMEGRTTLVIAHRLSTVRRADRIVLLEDGRVAEEGRHDELLARGGRYARMYRLFLEGE